MKRSCFACLILVLSFPCLALAVPSVSGLSGSLTQGSSVTISGSSFGTKSPAAPAFWDNGLLYSGFTSGQCIPLANSPVCPGNNPYGWSATSSTSAGHNVYYQPLSRGVWPAHYANYTNLSSPSTGYTGAGAETDLNNVQVAGVATTKQLYLAWWFYPYGNPNDSGVSANKWTRLLSGGPSGWGNSGVITVIAAPDSQIEAADTSTGTYYLSGYSTPVCTPSAWNRMEMRVDSHTPGPAINMALTSGTTVATGSATGTYTGNGVISWLYGLGADWANGNSTQDPPMAWGEIYADDTWSRVEMCSGSTWTARGHCEIQIPSAWTSSSVTATVNQGSFPNGSKAYVYVLDSTNTPNSSGYPVTFGSSSSSGSGSGSSAPAAPSGLHLIN